MKNKIGIALYPLRYENFPKIQEIFEILISSELGFEHMELSSEFLNDRIINFISSKEITYSLHLPHLYSIKVNFCSPNKSKFKEAESWIKKSILISKKLNAKLMTIHPDPHRNKKIGKKILEKHLLNNLDSLNKNQKILLENMPGKNYTIFSPEEILDFISLDKKRLGATWDIGHSIIALKNNFLHFPDALKNNIKEIHISGMKNNSDHFPLTNKNLPLKIIFKKLKEIKFNGPLVLEIIPKNIQEIVNSKKVLEKFI
ncbi:MAG: sugar phosphate isomerase/epimerase family protein [Nanoarchaeota archaeon]